MNEYFVREAKVGIVCTKRKRRSTVPSNLGNISSTHFKGILYGSSLEIIKYAMSSAFITYRLLMGIHKWSLETKLL